MTTQYASSRALAQRLIKNRGRNATIQRKSDGTPPDPSKPWKPGSTRYRNVVQLKPMVFLEYRVSENNALNSFALAATVGKALVPDAKQLAYVAAADLTERPKVGDVVVDGLSNHEVLEVEILAPGEEDVLYVLYLKE